MDGRPAVWIGHTALAVANVDRAADFWLGLGMREIERNDDVAVLELRGGTHLLLLRGEVPDGDDVPFDLMVDDLEGTHRGWSERGLDPSPIEQGRFHTTFTVRDPDGRRLSIYSSHVVGEV